MLKDNGFNVLGVHPTLQNYHDIPVYRSLREIEGDIDIVDIFLAGEKLSVIIDDILHKKPRFVWFQLGVHNDEIAAQLKKIILLLSKITVLLWS
jgi:predicted CoA-binding protein